MNPWTQKGLAGVTLPCWTPALIQTAPTQMIISTHITSHEKEQSWVYFIMSGCKNEVQGLMVVSLLMLLFDAFKVQMNQQDSVNSVQTGMCIGDF